MSEKPRRHVSVVIPARNEGRNIESAVRTLAGQPDVLEIIVADDGSEDSTRAVLDRLKTEVPFLATVRIESLPPGWIGKNYALWTGAKMVGGEWLLFTDADTEHFEGSLAELLEHARESQADFLSISPGQEMLTWWERAVIPQVYVHLARLYRFDEVSDPASPVAAANGQYVLIRRKAYDRVGGHEAVHGQILEDVELARRVKAAGGRLLFLPGARWARTHMYASFAEMWAGWSKNLYLLYDRNLGRILRVVGELWALDVAPIAFFLLLVGALLGRGASPATLLGLLVCSATVALRERRYRSAIGALGFEASVARYRLAGSALLGLLLLNSVRVFRLRGAVEWKGRKYPAAEVVRAGR